MCARVCHRALTLWGALGRSPTSSASLWSSPHSKSACFVGDTWVARAKMAVDTGQLRSECLQPGSVERDRQEHCAPAPGLGPRGVSRPSTQERQLTGPSWPLLHGSTTASWVDGATEVGGGLSRCMSASPFPWPPPRLRWGAGEERFLGVWRPGFEAAAKVDSPGKASPRIPVCASEGPAHSTAPAGGALGHGGAPHWRGHHLHPHSWRGDLSAAS